MAEGNQFSVGSSSSESSQHQHKHHGESSSLYGNITVLLCCVNAITIVLSSILKSRLVKGRSMTKRSFGRKCLIMLISIPIWAQVVSWSLIVFVLITFPYYKESSVISGLNGSLFHLHVELWKRSGVVSYALTPFMFVLALRPNPLPTVIYTKLLPLHKWCSRVFIIVMIYHSLMFFIIWIDSGEFWKKVSRFDIFPGVISFVLWFVVLLVSIKPIRVRIYRIFYMMHMIATWSLAPLMLIHAPNFKAFSYLNFVMIGFMLFSKVYFSATESHMSVEESFRVTRQPSSQLIILTLRKGYYEDGLKFYPGSHIRVNYGLLNPISWLFPSHPYTIASLDTDSEVNLIIKEMRFKILPLSAYNFSLPFDGLEHEYLTGNFQDHNITIVCGGSGIAFGLPIFRHFLYLLSQSHIEFERLHFIWITKTIHDLFILLHFGVLVKDINGEYFKTCDSENIDIYITADLRGEGGCEVDVQNLSKVKYLNQQYRTKGDRFPNDLELDVYSADESLLRNVSNESSALFIHRGRPNLSSVINKDFKAANFDENDAENNSLNSLFACGPEDLLNECSKLALEHNAEFITEPNEF